MPTRRVYTSFNGDVPFQVTFPDKTSARLYAYSDRDVDYDDEEWYKSVHWVRFRTVPVRRKWVAKGIVSDRGRIREDSHWRGSSVLLQTSKSRYVFVGGREAYAFTATNDSILKFHSLVGNSAVPYPVAVGKEFVYMMLDHVKVPKHHFRGTDLRDAYGTYYKKKLDREATPMGRVTVYKRR